MPSSRSTPHTALALSSGPRRDPRLRRLLHTVTGVLVVSLLAAVPASPALADECANAALRAQNDSSGLPDCRAYEMVSPSYKQGFGITPRTFSDNGTVSYTSTGSFAGNGLGQLNNQYAAVRSPAGWTTTAMNPPDVAYGAHLGEGAEGMSADLRQSLWLMRTFDQTDDIADYYIRDADGGFTRVGPGAIPGVVGSRPATKLVSADLSHVVFQHGTGAGPLLELVGIGNDGPPRDVSVDNTGQQTPGETCPRAISADGRVIIYSSGCNGLGNPQVWARVGGSASVAVSASECTRVPSDDGGTCNGPSPAAYEGSAADGSRVFFSTSQQLVNGDKDATNDLYACDIPPGALAPIGSANPCSTLTEVSGTPAGGAQVENIAAVSTDGSRVYFVAQGVLADNLGVNDSGAVAGGENLYLWVRDAAHPAGMTTFIATFPSGGVSQAQTTPDGRYLAFVTSSAVVTSGPGADGDNVPDMYRYDARARTMIRLSTSDSGSGGNDPALEATVNNSAALGRATTVMTSDGSTVVFETFEALSSHDTNGNVDVYEWHDGHVSQISGAGGGRFPWITPSGRDLFFVTSQQLTAGDGDGNGDVYDARVGGGFDTQQTTPCAGDECRGQPSLAPVVAGSPPTASPGSGAAQAAPAFSLRAVTAAQRKRLVTTGRVRLTITANTPGTLRATATATIAGRSITIASKRQTMAKAGTVSVALTLSKRARAQLAARGKLTIRLVVSDSKVAISRSATLRLTRASARGSRS
jgi:Tol biopolymer transport system component